MNEIAESAGETSYIAFLDRMGHLLQSAMPTTDASRDRLEEAEAELHRLRKEVALAEERVEVLSERYRRDRGVFMTMWETWKDEFTKQTESDRSAVDTAVGAAPEAPKP